jgi:DNA mismatch repair protein MutS2
MGKGHKSKLRRAARLAEAAQESPPAASVPAAREVPSAADGALADASLADFSAERLDWPAVRELFERQAASSLGRRMLSELQPRDAAGARAALARIGELLQLPGESAGPPLAEFADPLPVLDAAERLGQPLSAEDFSLLLGFLRATRRVADWLAAQRAPCPQLALLADGLPDLSPLAESIEAGIDARGQVRDEASLRLTHLRERLRGLIAELERSAKSIAGRPELRAALADGQVGRVHSRAGRPVLAVKAKAVGRVRGIVHDYSQTGETAFVEPESLVPLGNQLAALRGDEQREVTRLLVEWTRAVLDRRRGLERAAERLGLLELAVIGERYCRVYGALPPEVPPDGAAAVLVLKGARHPLLAEQQRAGVLARAVPLDLRLGEPFDVLVITGPNTGGKTLALKTAGLAALLVRLGLPLPCAAGTVVPLYAGVVADIGDEQEVQQSLSTFSSHLKRIAQGLRRAGPRTLFLLDELGGGTDPAEGAALGAALLEHLRTLRVPTLASTHIGRLKEFAFSRPRVENASVEFDAASLRPLYRLIVGTPGESRALQIAQRLGFDQRILGEARRRLERPSDESAKLMDDLRTAREQSERDRSSAEQRLAAAASRQAELEQEAAELARRSANLADEAQVALERRLSEARALLQRLRARAAQTPAPHGQAFEALAAELEAALSAGGLTDRRQAFLDGLKKGALVYLPRYRKRCPVLRLDRPRGRIVVRLGQRELDLSLDEVSAFEAV